MKVLFLSIGLIFCLSFASQAQNRKIHLYTDADIIKLSNYIKDLEYKDSLNNKIIEQYRQELAMLRKSDATMDQNNQSGSQPGKYEDELKQHPDTEGTKGPNVNDWE